LSLGDTVIVIAQVVLSLDVLDDPVGEALDLSKQTKNHQERGDGLASRLVQNIVDDHYHHRHYHYHQKW
jgi:hypothetical protein